MSRKSSCTERSRVARSNSERPWRAFARTASEAAESSGVHENGNAEKRCPKRGWQANRTSYSAAGSEAARTAGRATWESVAASPKNNTRALCAGSGIAAPPGSPKRRGNASGHQNEPGQYRGGPESYLGAAAQPHTPRQQQPHAGHQPGEAGDGPRQRFDLLQRGRRQVRLAHVIASLDAHQQVHQARRQAQQIHGVLQQRFRRGLIVFLDQPQRQRRSSRQRAELRIEPRNHAGKYSQGAKYEQHVGLKLERRFVQEFLVFRQQG